MLTDFTWNKGLKKAILFGRYKAAVIQVFFSILLKLMGASYLTHRLL